MRSALYGAPSGLPAISPTGGEIRCRVGFRQSPTFASKGAKGRAPISPLVGEMSGRTEGALSRRLSTFRGGVLRRP
ncbi:propionyl-coenzyme A carboxylase alpha polypeptide [Mesorhizobium sp. M1A.F.Ca.IN.020.06.1.1]|nr:propionyl-coenzyme A carboxylase alpha polypeptide [Mesorhizobium sp. M1A.F.Ca.IN.020.03.2.1]RUV87552.1 propionyl-coenzyme A carboxylase alpha polypeptide [Mesorhizobium sp. M1A.F.Ca.IN.020.32.1.1]RUW10941.1 propionyl-coenzyme A carboxylase alpha polypeptide [Mesorhizobium sp. M1A.F.Ca.IN.022.05.2.1]RUW32973.1 propionyl-coenzyme A carboxylase alpha polypeptide [Mesorhizobium sp. M1A.F.Ca.IN.020.06.1.1]RWF83084.1 MAG: propionyl-coenzyme A carboxylase alpha polypeptide [Mesorhizobium sp.]